MPQTALEWNPKALRFRNPDTGRFITRDEVRRWLDKLIDASQRRVQDASLLVRDGKISVSAWEEIMRQEIKRTQLGAAALLNGGWKNLGPREYGRVGGLVREQFRFLDKLANDLRQKKIPTDGRFLNRAGQYPAAARSDFHDAQGERLESAGYTEERSVLAPAEHCGECVDQASLGWVPIGTCVPVGQRQCGNNCHCSMRYR